MTAQHTIDDALCDPALLGAALVDSASWQVWRVVLKAGFGIELDEAEARIFASVAGERQPPAQRVRELWAIIGRRGGKSRMAAALAVYIACFQQHRLASGERGLVLCLAASQDQAKIVFRYVLAFLEASPILKQEIANVTRTEITLCSGIVIAVHSTSFRTIRGRTLVACIFDEIAYWRDEASATPDVETYRAVLPSLATTNGMLIGISTPYRKMGLLHAKFRDHFGVDDDEVLVVQGSTATFNPSLSAATIETQRTADPTSASSEWDAEFRADISSFLDDALIEQAIEHGRPLELPPVKTLFGSVYKSFVDPSGGVGADSYTLAIAHRDGEQYILDLVRGTSGRFDPQVVTQEYAALVREYGVQKTPRSWWHERAEEPDPCHPSGRRPLKEQRPQTCRGYYGHSRLVRSGSMNERRPDAYKAEALHSGGATTRTMVPWPRPLAKVGNGARRLRAAPSITRRSVTPVKVEKWARLASAAVCRAA